jgi:uncharacterized protein YvpB
MGCNKARQFSGFLEIVKGSIHKKAIIVSCIRCGCTIDDLNNLIDKNDPIVVSYDFYGDTTCLNKFKLRNKVNHTPQAKLDSISVDFYNLLIYNKAKYGDKLKMIRTEDSENLKAFL